MLMLMLGEGFRAQFAHVRPPSGAVELGVSVVTLRGTVLGCWRVFRVQGNSAVCFRGILGLENIRGASSATTG